MSRLLVAQPKRRIYRGNATRVFIGDAASALQQLEGIAATYQTDRIMIVLMIHGEESRQGAVELLGAANDEA